MDAEHTALDGHFAAGQAARHKHASAKVAEFEAQTAAKIAALWQAKAAKDAEQQDLLYKRKNSDNKARCARQLEAAEREQLELRHLASST